MISTRVKRGGRKIFTTFCTVFLFAGLQAQIQFERILPPLPAPQVIADFQQVNGGSAVAFADVDGDNDDDVLISGVNNYAERISNLYTNEGNGNFTLVAGTSFEGVSEGSIAFLDVDGDSDSDVLIRGVNDLFQLSTRLYINDGNGNFSFVPGTPFDGVRYGSMALADVDGDNDPDLLITGLNTAGLSIAKLYLNNGSGNFTLKTGTPFIGVQFSACAFADINGDGDQDVIISGFTSANQTVTKLYVNDGNGNFSSVSSLLEGVTFGAIAFADTDNDGDLDVIINGDGNFGPITKLYKNNGNGSFAVAIVDAFVGVSKGTIDFADVNGNGYPDVVISGFNSIGRSTNLYTNTGSGFMLTVYGTPFPHVGFSDNSFADVDGDNDHDILITGQSANGIITELYTNDGNGIFVPVTGSPFDAVGSASLAFSDVNGDDHVDVVIMEQLTQQKSVKLYTNDGNGLFNKISGTPSQSIIAGSIDLADLNGDDDPDILITGQLINDFPITFQYSNNGSGNFTLVPDTPFDKVSFGSTGFADVDGDGDVDILITGSSLNGPIAKLYSNDGDGNFTLITDTPFGGVTRSKCIFGDVNGDGYPDVLISGMNAADEFTTRLYINNTNGNFTLMEGTPFDGVIFGAIAFANVDEDDDPDIFITGLNSLSEPIAKLYINDGSGNYSIANNTPFEGVQHSSVAFADIDGDGDQDVLIAGSNISNPDLTQLYINDGNGNFSFVADITFVGVHSGTVAFADVDGDDKPDILITGYSLYGKTARLYRNTTPSLSCTVSASCTPYTLTLSAAGTATMNPFDLNNGSSVSCGTPLLSLSQTEFDCTHIGENTVTLTVEDENGNTQTCTNTVTVVDNLPPVASCANIEVYLDENGLATITPEHVGGNSIDNCVILSIELNTDTFSENDFGLHEVIVTVTDLSGNLSTCIANVTVLPYDATCQANGGSLNAPSDVSFCVGTGTPVGINISITGATGSLQRWALINATGNIIETRTNNSLFNLDNKTPGNYTIGYMRYESDVNLAGLTNISQINNLQGCFSLASNPIQIFLRPQPFGGVISPTTTTSICANQGPLTRVQVNLTGAVGEFTRFGILDPDDNNRIVGSSAIPNINFNGLSSGNYLIVHLSYQAGVNLSQVQFPSDLTGCYDVSNVIPVDVLDCFGRATLTSQPNPTSAQSYVTFTNPVEAQTTLEVFDLNGRMITQLFNSHSAPGQEYRFEFDASQLPNGVYVYRLTTGREVLIEKFMIAR